MININLELTNPYVNQNFFKSLYSPEYLVSKNKFLSFEVCYEPECIAKLHLSLIWRGKDHAGPEITIGFIGITFMLALFDRRHWNYEENRWYKENEEYFE